MTPKISRRLHLVIPVYQGKTTIYAHHTPIDSDCFDRFFMPISKTFSRLFGQGLGITSGPKVAAKVLHQVAEEDGIWDSTDANAITVKRGLMAEVRRLTNVVVPAEKGWDTLPFEDAVTNGTLDAEDADEIENAIVFFSVSWHMHARRIRPIVLEGAAELRGGLVTSLDAMAYRDSLPTSTPAEGTTKSPG